MRLWDVESLLQHHEPVTPVAKIIDLSRCGVERAVWSGFRIEMQFLLLLAEPFAWPSVARWNEQAERAQCLVYQVLGELCAAWHQLIQPSLRTGRFSVVTLERKHHKACRRLADWMITQLCWRMKEKKGLFTYHIDSRCSSRNEAWWKRITFVSSSFIDKWSARLLVHCTWMPAIFSRLAAVKALGSWIISVDCPFGENASSIASPRDRPLFHKTECPGVTKCCKESIDVESQILTASVRDALIGASSGGVLAVEELVRSFSAIIDRCSRLSVDWMCATTCRSSRCVRTESWLAAASHCSSNQSSKKAVSPLSRQRKSCSARLRLKISLIMSLLTDNARECVDASGQSSGSSDVFTVMLKESKPYCFI